MSYDRWKTEGDVVKCDGGCGRTERDDGFVTHFGSALCPDCLERKGCEGHMFTCSTCKKTKCLCENVAGGEECDGCWIATTIIRGDS